MAALNAQGPCYGCVVNPPATWSFNYAGNTTNRFFFSGGCSSCTDTAAGANLGTAATEVFVLVTVSGGGAAGVPASVNCDTQGGGSPVSLTLDTTANNGGNVSIWRGALASNASATRTCTVVWSGTAVSSQFREYYMMTVSGLTNLSAPDFVGPIGGVTSGVSPVTFNSNSIVMAACDRGNPIYPFFLTGTLTPTVASPTTITLATDQDQTVHTASMGVFAPPFNTTVGSASCSGSAGGALAIAAYH